MRKGILKQLAFAVMASSLMTQVVAVGSGLYMGVMLGPANNSASNVQAQALGPATSPPTTVQVTPKSQQFGSRINMGYMVNPYAGFEWGATYFTGISYKTHGTEQVCGNATARVRDIELLGKGVVPVKSINLFGKAGVAAAYQTNGGALNPTTKNICGQSVYTNKVVPVFSIGAGYDLSQNWVAEVALHNVQVGGKVGGMTMYALGISYHFVDTYCGQFLC